MGKRKGQDIFNFLVVTLAIIVIAGAIYVRFVKPELLETVSKQEPITVNTKVVNEILAGTVTIQGRSYQNERLTGVSSGSGFLINEHGYIVTNEHVVNNCQRLIAIDHSGKSQLATLIAADNRLDIAVLKINAENTEHLELGNSRNLNYGQPIIAAGNPLNGASDGRAVVTFGRISKLKEQCNDNPDFKNDRFYDNLIQFDASVYPGSSGGPLLDMAGRVIGIVVAVSSNNSYGKFGYAISLDDRTINAIAKLQDGSEIEHGFLGAILDDEIPMETVKEYQLDNLSGACVNSVLPGSPAAKAGIISGDIVIKFDDRQIFNRLDLISSVDNKTNNDIVKIKLLRPEYGKLRKIDLTARLENRTLANRDGYLTETQLPRSSGWGIMVTPLSQWRRAKDGIPATTNGLIVWEVKPDSLAFKQGIKSGDIITAINGKNVSTLAEFEQINSDCLFSPKFEIWTGGIIHANHH